MPEIKQFPVMRVACVTQTGPFDQAIPNGINQLASWAQANNVQPEGQPFAMFLDDPAEVPIEQVRTRVCLPVGSDASESDDVQIQEIGGFDVATLAYQDRTDMGRYYDELYRWLHEQGYHDAGAPMETYMNLDDFMAEIAIPVAREEVIVETIEELAEPEPIKPSPDPWKRAPAKKAAKQAAKKGATKRAAGKKTAKKAAKQAVKKTAKKATKKRANK